MEVYLVRSSAMLSPLEINHLSYVMIRMNITELCVEQKTMVGVVHKKYTGRSSASTRSKMARKECPICISRFAPKQNITKFACGHRFHTKCINRWLERNNCCPLCRATTDLSINGYCKNAQAANIRFKLSYTNGKASFRFH